MTTQTTPLTSEQCIVSLQRLSKQNGFTDADLAIHNSLCNPATEPMLFDNAFIEPTYGFRFKGRRLISINDVDTNDLYGQSVRKGPNQEFENINSSIQDEGFKLKQVMPCAYFKNKKWVILEGRTRISILKAIGVTDKLIINEYEKVNTKISDGAFGLHSNTVYDPKGMASVDDMILHLQTLLADGYFEFDTSISQDEAKRDFKKEIKTYAKTKFPKLKLLSSVVETLLSTAMVNKNVKHNIKSFNSLKEAMAHVNNVLNVNDTKKYKYVMTSTDEYRFIKDVVPVWKEMRNNGDMRTIRLIACKLAPDSAVDWHLANVRVGRKMMQHIESLMEIFGTDLSDTPQVEIYGTIPQCESLAAKYPMDKLVQYSKITDAEYNLHGAKV